MSTSVTLAPSATASTAYGGGAPSATSLQAQLERFQQQLSDCVNCASAKTPQGKSDIQAISARISQIEQRIAQTQQSTHDRSDKQTAPVQGMPTAAPTSLSGAGGLIDVFA